MIKLYCAEIKISKGTMVPMNEREIESDSFLYEGAIGNTPITLKAVFKDNKIVSVEPLPEFKELYDSVYGEDLKSIEEEEAEDILWSGEGLTVDKETQEKYGFKENTIAYTRDEDDDCFF